MDPKYGARIFTVGKTILVKQTIKGATGYIIDKDKDGNHRERHVKPDDSAGIADAVRKALKGNLKGR